MRFFEGILDKIRSNRKWFMGTMTTLVAALIVIVITLALLPEAKASAITDDPVNKTMTYNIPQIVAEYNGASGLCEIIIDVTDPEYKYYIVSDGSTYRDVSIIVNYELETSAVVPIYLEDVVIGMTKDAPILKFSPSTNDNLNTNGSYKVIVKGDCSFISHCTGAKYPLVQVESISTKLYQFKLNVNADHMDDPTYWYDVVSSDFATNIEFTSYEYAPGEKKEECRLFMVTSQGGTGAGIGTTSGTIDMTAENVELSDGSGIVYPDLADGSLSEIFGGKPLKEGVQALYGSSGFAGDVTISGALNLCITSAGYGACIGGGGNEFLGYEPKDGGKVIINGGAISLLTGKVETNAGTFYVPAIGGGVDKNTGEYGGYEQVVINGGSLYMANNEVPFGAADLYPVNSNGDKLYQFDTNYVEDIDPNTGKLLIASERYEDKHYADISIVDDYVNIRYEYSADDYSLMTYTYEGFGYGSVGNLGSKMFIWLPATPLCGLTFDDSCYLESTIPTFEMVYNDKKLTMEDGAFWLYGEGKLTLKNIPSFISIDSIVLTEDRTGISRDYTSELQYDATTEEYTLNLNVFSNSTISMTYSSDVIISYDYNFAEGDTHNVTNTSPIEFEMGDELILNDNMVVADDLIFDGWYSEITGERITYINDTNVDSISDNLGRVKLKAKWKVKVKYDFGEGTGEDIEEQLIPYNQESQIILSSDIPTLKYFEFGGWTVDGQIYLAGDVCTVKPIKDVIITANYMKNSYFVYIDASASKFNVENVDVWVGIQGSSVNPENNRLMKNADGSYKVVDINGIPYYQAIVDDGTKLAIILTPNPGRVIVDQSIIITEGNGGQMVVGAAGNQDGGMLIQLTIDEDDVYISTDSEFALRDYEIKFYDGMSTYGGGQLWADEKFTYTINELDKTIGEILGSRADDILAMNNRFLIFKGWMDKLTGKMYSNGDALGENMGDMILVAQWEILEKYPVHTNVVDVATGNSLTNVFAIPYYVNEDGSLEKMYSENDILFTKANQDIKILLYYYDNSGNIKELTKGVVVNNIEIAYKDTTGSIVTKKVTNPFCSPMIMAGTDLTITVNIAIEKYNIVYWDTKGFENKNPSSYTFFDEIELVELAENVGWLLVTSEKNESNYDDIVAKPVTKIERGTAGNLVLKADWSDYSEKTYKAEIDDLIEHGKLEIVYPVNKDSYIPNETLVIKVTPDVGYKLKNNVITYREMQVVSLDTALASTFSLKSNIVMYGAAEVTGSDGIYLVDMPEKNIIFTAIFEIEEYTITYKEVGDLKNDNVDKYTYFDSIQLLPLEKEGYDFVGWMDEKGNIINKLENSTGNLVLAPVFKETVVIPEETTKPEEETTEPEEETTTKPEEPTIKEEETTKPRVEINTDGNVDNNLEVETKKPHLVGGGNAYGSETYTGDTSNVTRLILICAAAVIVLFIVVLSKGEKKEEEKTEDDSENVTTS